jgi:hypothetical protein
MRAEWELIFRALSERTDETPPHIDWLPLDWQMTGAPELPTPIQVLPERGGTQFLTWWRSFVLGHQTPKRLASGIAFVLYPVRLEQVERIAPAPFHTIHRHV